MRILLDANYYLQYLLYRQRKTALDNIMTAVFTGRLRLLLPEGTLTAFAQRIGDKHYLAERLTVKELHQLVYIIRLVAEEIPVIEAALPEVTRNPKSDLLLAYALIGEADFLVTGDEQLINLGVVGSLRIVTPAGLAARI